MVLAIFPPADIDFSFITTDEFDFSTETIKLMVFELTFLIKVPFAAGAGFSTNSLELVKSVKLPDIGELNWRFNFILGKDLDFNELSIGISLEFDQSIGVNFAVIELAESVFECMSGTSVRC